MSFTYEIKQELSKAQPNCESCNLAECLGVLLYCHKFSPDGVRIQSSNPAVRRRVQALLQQTFGFQAEEEDEKVLSIREPDQVGELFEAFGLSRKRGALSLNFGLMEEDCCKLSFFRGAFLTGGSVSAGASGYHLELVTSHFSITKQASYLLSDLGMPMSMATRRGNYLLYSKDSGVIEDFLSAIGATQGAMQLMLAKVERELSNNVNRKVNCDVANLNKTVMAASRQVEAIRQLQRCGRLSKLSPNLQETAKLRMAHPEMSLSELVPLFSQPVSKPGLNNRLRKLQQLAAEEEA